MTELVPLPKWHTLTLTNEAMDLGDRVLLLGRVDAADRDSQILIGLYDGIEVSHSQWMATGRPTKVGTRIEFQSNGQVGENHLLEELDLVYHMLRPIDVRAKFKSPVSDSTNIVSLEMMRAKLRPKP